MQNHKDNPLFGSVGPWKYIYRRTPNTFTTIGHYAGYFAGSAGGVTIGILSLAELLMFSSAASLVASPAKIMLMRPFFYLAQTSGFIVSRVGIVFDTVIGAGIATVKSNLYSYISYEQAKEVLDAQTYFMKNFDKIDGEALENFFIKILQQYLYETPSRLKQSNNSKVLVALFAKESSYKEKMLRVFEYLHNSENFGCNLHKIMTLKLIEFFKEDNFKLKENLTGEATTPEKLACPLSGSLYIFPVKIGESENGDGLIYCLSSLMDYVKSSRKNTMIGDHGGEMKLDFEKLIFSEHKQAELNQYRMKSIENEFTHSIDIYSIKHGKISTVPNNAKLA